jgi:hypothetical protein
LTRGHVCVQCAYMGHFDWLFDWPLSRNTIDFRGYGMNKAFEKWYSRSLNREVLLTPCWVAKWGRPSNKDFQIFPPSSEGPKFTFLLSDIGHILFWGYYIIDALSRQPTKWCNTLSYITAKKRIVYYILKSSQNYPLF